MSNVTAIVQSSDRFTSLHIASPQIYPQPHPQSPQAAFIDRADEAKQRAHLSATSATRPPPVDYIVQRAGSGPGSQSSPRLGSASVGSPVSNFIYACASIAALIAPSSSWALSALPKLAVYVATPPVDSAKSSLTVLSPMLT